MKHCFADDKLPEKALEVIHCPRCGGTSTALKNSKGRFHGSVGSFLARYGCSDCGKSFNLLITGDDFFPDRGFGVIEDDFNIKFQ